MKFRVKELFLLNIAGKGLLLTIYKDHLRHYNWKKINLCRQLNKYFMNWLYCTSIFLEFSWLYELSRCLWIVYWNPWRTNKPQLQKLNIVIPSDFSTFIFQFALFACLWEYFLAFLKSFALNLIYSFLTYTVWGMSRIN